MTMTHKILERYKSMLTADMGYKNTCKMTDRTMFLFADK